MSTPSGYALHHSIDMGGRMTNLGGQRRQCMTRSSISMAGRACQAETFDLHALPGNKHTLVDDLTAFGTGFGGDPNNMAKLDSSKGKFYEFSGMFRRDRLYSDYDLLAQPNIPSGLFDQQHGQRQWPPRRLAWPQVNKSPVMFNIVRRMTDTNLTLMPLATFSVPVRLLAQHHGRADAQPLLHDPEVQRAARAVRAQRQRRLHGRGRLEAAQPTPRSASKCRPITTNPTRSSRWIPNGFLVQEADGTPAYLGNFTSFAPYGISVSAACNTASMGGGYTSATNYTIISPAQQTGRHADHQSGMRCGNELPALAAHPDLDTDRNNAPAERGFQEHHMNGNVHYTLGASDMPHYYESAQGLTPGHRGTAIARPSGRAATPRLTIRSSAPISASSGRFLRGSASPTRRPTPALTSRVLDHSAADRTGGSSRCGQSAPSITPARWMQERARCLTATTAP